MDQLKEDGEPEKAPSEEIILTEEIILNSLDFPSIQEITEALLSEGKIYGQKITPMNGIYVCYTASDKDEKDSANKSAPLNQDCPGISMVDERSNGLIKYGVKTIYVPSKEAIKPSFGVCVTKIDNGYTVEAQNAPDKKITTRSFRPASKMIKPFQLGKYFIKFIPTNPS